MERDYASFDTFPIPILFRDGVCVFALLFENVLARLRYKTPTDRPKLKVKKTNLFT